MKLLLHTQLTKLQVLHTNVIQKVTPDNETFLGFTSVHDFIDSLFRLKHWSINSTVAIIGAMTTFITGYMWDTASAIYTLYALMGADWLTGVVKSMRKREFNSYRLWRMPLYFIAVSFILSITWWIEKSNKLFFFLPSIAIAGFYSVYFTSLLENLGELELLPKTLVSVLRKKFGLKAIIQKINDK